MGNSSSTIPWPHLIYSLALLFPSDDDKKSKLSTAFYLTGGCGDALVSHCPYRPHGRQCSRSFLIPFLHCRLVSWSVQLIVIISVSWTCSSAQLQAVAALVVIPGKYHNKYATLTMNNPRSIHSLPRVSHLTAIVHLFVASRSLTSSSACKQNAQPVRNQTTYNDRQFMIVQENRNAFDQYRS